MGIFMGICIGMFEICVYAPGPATPRPPPHGMGPIYCPYEIFPLPLWCGRGVWHCPPPPPVVWWGCGTVPPPPRAVVWWGCGTVPLPPCGVVRVWYGMLGMYGVYGRSGMACLESMVCLVGMVCIA